MSTILLHQRVNATNYVFICDMWKVILLFIGLMQGQNEIMYLQMLYELLLMLSPYGV
jgi:hypothetical protein